MRYFDISALAVEESQFVCSDRKLATAAEARGLATICPGLS
jgi:hypothetical protein